MTDFVCLKPEPLSITAFAPFGTVLDANNATPMIINQGYALRFDDLCAVDVRSESGDVKVSLFIAEPRPMPIAVTMMERHPLGSQAFLPMQNQDWLVVVCLDPDDPKTYRCFNATGRQGVNYKPGCWHHPLLVCEHNSHFVVIDRKGSGNNLEEVGLPATLRIAIAL